MQNRTSRSNVRGVEVEKLLAEQKAKAEVDTAILLRHKAELEAEEEQFRRDVDTGAVTIAKTSRKRKATGADNLQVSDIIPNNGSSSSTGGSSSSVSSRSAIPPLPSPQFDLTQNLPANLAVHNNDDNNFDIRSIIMTSTVLLISTHWDNTADTDAFGPGDDLSDFLDLQSCFILEIALQAKNTGDQRLTTHGYNSL
jgi:hypothetical protein